MNTPEPIQTTTPDQEPEQKQEAKGYFYTIGTVRRVGPKVGRNDPCHCGSGVKYKKCCLAANPMSDMPIAKRIYLTEQIRQQRERDEMQRQIDAVNKTRQGGEE